MAKKQAPPVVDDTTPTISPVSPAVTDPATPPADGENPSDDATVTMVDPHKTPENSGGTTTVIAKKKESTPEAKEKADLVKAYIDKFVANGNYDVVKEQTEDWLTKNIDGYVAE